MITRMLLLLNMATLLALAACGSFSGQSELVPEYSKSPRRFEVSVSSDGQAVPDYMTELVHRIQVTPEQVQRVLAPWPERLDLPFLIRAEQDTWGKPHGVRLVRMGKQGVTSFLGLEEGDLVTAVDTQHASGVQDLWRLFELLRRKREVTLTLDRESKPHKNIYYLSASQAER